MNSKDAKRDECQKDEVAVCNNGPARECPPRPARAAAWLAIAVGASLLAGCMAERGIQRDMRSRVQASRAQAYRQWQRERAEENEAKPLVDGDLTLQAALQVAAAFNKGIQAALKESEAAQGAVTEAYSHALPTVAATGDYTRLDKEPRIKVGGASVSMGDVDNYSLGLELRQPLFRGGAVLATIRSSRWGALLADEQVRAATQAVVFEVSKAYYDVLLAQQFYETNRAAVESAEAHLREVEAKRGQGLASDLDVLRAQVEVSTFEAAMIQQRNRIRVAETQLLRAMGVSQESAFSLSDELAYAPAAADHEEAVRLAMENRPDLYMAEMGLHVQEEAARAARGRYFPTVDAWLAQGWERPGSGDGSSSRWDDAWRAGVSARWTLFDGFGRRGRMVQEQARLRRRKIELADAEDRAMQEVQEAILSLEDAEEFVQSQSKNLERAEEALRLAEVEYREGVRPAVTVTEARAALTNARGLYYESLYRHAMAGLNLRRAAGVLEPPSGGAREAAPLSDEADAFPAEANLSASDKEPHAKPPSMGGPPMPPCQKPKTLGAIATATGGTPVLRKGVARPHNAKGTDE